MFYRIHYQSQAFLAAIMPKIIQKMLKALLWISVVSVFRAFLRGWAAHEAEVMSVVESKHLFRAQVSQLASLDGRNRTLIKLQITHTTGMSHSIVFSLTLLLALISKLTDSFTGSLPSFQTITPMLVYTQYTLRNAGTGVHLCPLSQLFHRCTITGT